MSPETRSCLAVLVGATATADFFLPFFFKCFLRGWFADPIINQPCSIAFKVGSLFNSLDRNVALAAVALLPCCPNFSGKMYL